MRIHISKYEKSTTPTALLIETVKNMGILISSLTLQIHYFKTNSIFAQTSKVYLYAEKIFYPNNMRGD